MESRVGVGVVLPDFNSLGALSLRYHPSPYFTMQAILGFSTESGINATILGGKILRNAYLEENMNFYVGVGGMIVADKGGSTLVKTGIEIDALLGAEFFFSGLPNLGFQFETGIGVRSLRGTSIRTLGSGLSSVGIHYYF